jgi:hypothetical protein
MRKFTHAAVENSIIYGVTIFFEKYQNDRKGKLFFYINWLQPGN